MSKHTQGPWVIDNNHPNNPESPYLPDAQSIVQKNGVGWNICEVFGNVGEEAVTPTGESIANAKLIAASPELLEALKEFPGFNVFDKDIMAAWVKKVDELIQRIENQ